MMLKLITFKASVCGTTAMTLALLAFPCSGALAQDAPDPGQTEAVTQDVSTTEPEAAPEAGTIFVTASRTGRQGYDAPTPTTIVNAAQLEQRGTTNIASYLSEVPAFKASTSPTTNGINQRAAGSSYVDLRGLGSSRTLVLVDGKRFVPQVAAGLAGYQVDLNQIPALMVERVEVVTGGASAQWGSDAVAGVVNVLLKKDFEGIQAEAQVGRSTHGDYDSLRLGVLGGVSFGGDRGNLTAAVDFEQNWGVGDVNTRGWGREHNYLLVNPCPNQVAVSASCPGGGNGQAVNLILPDVQFSTQAPGGVINNTALRGTTFGPGGTPMPFLYGDYAGSTFMQGGSQPGVNFTRVQQIAQPYKRVQTYGRLSYDLTDNITAYAEASYAYNNGGGKGGPSRTTQTIRADNAFLPDETRAEMQDLGISSFSMGSVLYDAVFEGDLTTNTTRGAVGLEGTIPSDGNWRWSVAAGRGVNKYKQRVTTSTILANMAFATDAVLQDGQAVCRATIPGPSFNPAAAGCVPINLFGEGSASAGAFGYVFGTIHADIDYEQNFATAEISGEPFSTWAGPVSVGLGAEYRDEKEVAISDPISNIAGYNGNNSSSFSGSFNVKEAFAEVVVPLLADVPLAQALELNGAVRYAQYSGSSGGQVTWKAGATYRPFDDLLIRVARSRDIRAPNIFEQNVPATSRNSTIRFGNVQVIIPTFSSGNPDLVPEVSDTTTVGFSYEPSFVPGLVFSVDYWKIGLEDVISTLSAQDVADLCSVADEQEFCDLISFDSVGAPTAVRTPFFNLASVKMSGIDGQASYRLPLDQISAGLPGSLTFNLSGTYTLHSKVNSGTLGAQTIDRAGETGPRNEFSAARFRFTGSATYSDENFSLSVQLRHVSAGNYDNTFTPLLINNNRVEGRTYTDLSANYDLNDNFTVFGVVNNLFDLAPPTAPTENASPTNAIYFDSIGTVLKLGVRMKY